MPRPALELADIFRQHGPAYRQAHDLPWHRQRLMQAIEECRTPALGGVVEWCDHCQYTHIQYRSCRGARWALHFHPHLHCVVPGGGLSPREDRWIHGRRRFLLHALPPGFQRIRYYGLLANCHRAARLELCRRLLATPTADLLPRASDYRDFYLQLTGINLRLCPQCGIGALFRLALPRPSPLVVDTS